MLMNHPNQILSRPQSIDTLLNIKIMKNSPLTKKTTSVCSLGICSWLGYVSVGGRQCRYYWVAKTKSSEHFIKPNYSA